MFGRDQPKHWVRWRLITIHTDQLSLREPVLVMLHELLLQLPVVFGLVWRLVLIELIIQHSHQPLECILIFSLAKMSIIRKHTG